MAVIQKIILLMIGFFSFVFTVLVDAEQSINFESEIKVIALFKSGAMLDYRGKQKIYRVGQNISPEIKLIKANNRIATFLINEKRIELGLNSGFSFSDPRLKITTKTKSQSEQVVTEEENQQENKSASIYRNINGMFQTPGSINGRGVRFLVDTGASQVAMNESVAKLVGLNYKMDGQKVVVSTAAGPSSAWTAVLSRVKVGNLELRNVQALIIKGNGPTEVLLGMSFLNRVKMQNDGNLIILSKKY